MGELAALGHRRIAVSAYESELRPGRQVREGFADATAQFGLEDSPEPIIDLSDLNAEADGVVAERVITADATAAVIGGPTSLLARSLRRLRERLGTDPFPRRLSIVTVGNEALADVHEPALAHVTRPVERIADAVADQLLRRLEEPSSPAESITISLEFRTGPSIGPPNR